jgi:hypothetical protein
MKTNNDNSKDESHAGEQSWVERNVNLFIAGLVIACIATLVAQRVFSPMSSEEHPAHFEIEKIFGFEAIFGFVAFVVVVFLGWLLRFFVKRDEDYYDS